MGVALCVGEIVLECMGLIAWAKLGECVGVIASVRIGVCGCTCMSCVYL